MSKLILDGLAIIVLVAFIVGIACGVYSSIPPESRMTVLIIIGIAGVFSWALIRLIGNSVEREMRNK